MLCIEGSVVPKSSRRKSVERRRRIREEEESYYIKSSNRRKAERNSRRDISLDINYGWSSNRKRGRDDVSLHIHSRNSSSNRIRKREDISSKNRRDTSSSRSLIKYDINNTISSSKCIDVPAKKSYEEDEINATPVVSFPYFLDDGVLTEILIRLPVESLLRFKSVCKHWLSLIKRIQNIIHLQSTHSAYLKLLCISPEKEETKMRILSANLSVKTGKVIIHNVKKTREDDWFNYDQVLGPVNGLVCFIDLGTKDYFPNGLGTKAARIYNVTTREITPWIKSTLLEEENKYASEAIVSVYKPIYQIGFDPVKKEHKVFCFWRLSPKDHELSCDFYKDSPGSYASWEAFTVGRDTKWRRISVVPDDNNLIKINEVIPRQCPVRSHVQANGCIYWRNKLMARVSDFDDPESAVPDYAPTEPDVIVAFDVGSEKFRIIPIPSFILDEPREIFDGQRRKTMIRPIAMLILSGRVTLIYPMSVNTVKLWMLDDGVDKQLENCQGKGSSNWIAETITLPLPFIAYGFHGVATSADNILISQYRVIDVSHKPVDCLYSYDLKTKTFNEIEMDGILSIPPLHTSRSLLTTFTGSLIPVQPQQNMVDN